ncbi:hypothetical protein NL676_026195 [Syzygium grande]|nr:hypothetical protein NL676_026195 [Syzygium grande]
MELAELWAIFGPGVAGAVFGAGWWFWVDAVVCSSVNKFITNEVEALAFLCLCCFICLSGSICGPVNSRFTRDLWTFSLDRSCWCLAMRVCVDQWTNLLDIALRVRPWSVTMYFVNISRWRTL